MGVCRALGLSPWLLNAKARCILDPSYERFDVVLSDWIEKRRIKLEDSSVDGKDLPVVSKKCEGMVRPNPGDHVECINGVILNGDYEEAKRLWENSVLPLTIRFIAGPNSPPPPSDDLFHPILLSVEIGTEITEKQLINIVLILGVTEGLTEARAKTAFDSIQSNNEVYFPGLVSLCYCESILLISSNIEKQHISLAG